MSDRVRVVVADHSAFVRRAVERMLSSEPGIDVVGEASTGHEAIAVAIRLRADVVILAVDVPDIDGAEALRAIISRAPAGVLMLSTPTPQGAQITLNALEAGAVDFVDKTGTGSEMDIYDIGAQLREKVLAVAGAAMRQPRPVAAAGLAAAREAAQTARAAETDRQYDVVVIGASTGGPRALAQLLSDLPADFGAGVVVAQHMPPGFTRTLADRLDRRCPLHVREAADGDRILPGIVLVSPGGAHATLERRGKRLRLRVDAGPSELIHKPSVDRLFHSAVDACGARAVGVVLTGMGDDGSRGLAALRAAGSYTISESEATATIFGMPRAAAAAAERVLPLSQIAPFLVSLCAPERV